jgi:uncharacterized membrane protein
MSELVAALALFVAAHSLPTPTGLRAAAVRRLGRGRWVALYSLVSVASLAWVVSAAIRAPHVALWTPTTWMAATPVVAMIPACLLAAMGAARPNAWSVSFRGGAADAAAPGVLAVTRHPLLWAFFLWGASHALANGDLAAVTLFGGAGAFALAGMPLLEARARRRGEREPPPLGWRAWAAALATRRCAIEAVVGLALYLALLAAHAPVIGVDPLWPLR